MSIGNAGKGTGYFSTNGKGAAIVGKAREENRGAGEKRKKESHLYERVANDFYSEPEWCSHRLFEEERFDGRLHDPACGGGSIPRGAMLAGLDCSYSDIRGTALTAPQNFFEAAETRDNIISNPPFKIFRQFAIHALKHARHKVALILPVARLNAAHWLTKTPLKTIWLMTPRPSMPPGDMIAAGVKAGGGTVDFCWLVWRYGYTGYPEMKWLHRDRERQGVY